MPQSKAIVIHPWVKAIKKNQTSSDCLWHLLPGLMQWCSMEFMATQLLAFTPNSAVRKQMTQVMTHLKELIDEVDSVHLGMMARITTTEFIHNQLIVTFSPDIKNPEKIGAMALNVNTDGNIISIAREYTLNYQTNRF